jgi:hypothetical protein
MPWTPTAAEDCPVVEIVPADYAVFDEPLAGFRQLLVLFLGL